jgi:hypothetical protein
MRSRPHRHDSSAEETKAAADKLLEVILTQGKAQFGDAMQSFWFYDDEFCPGCGVRPIDTTKIKGKEAVAINGFIYRPRGVLIGYFLCGTCAAYIHSEVKKNPFKETPLHADIERNLIAKYHKHLSTLNA